MLSAFAQIIIDIPSLPPHDTLTWSRVRWYYSLITDALKQRTKEQ